MQNPKFQTKTLKEEKARRHRICQEQFGEDWEWDYEPNFYKKYASLNTLRVKRPFKLSECRQFDPSKTKTDPLKRYYKGPINETQCDKVEGVWDGKSASRENLIDRGVCWVRPDDKHCASSYDKTELISYKRRGSKGYLLPSTLHQAHKACAHDDRCEWDSRSFQCVSLAAMEELDKLRIPRLPTDWPIDITSTNIQEYLHQYYSRLLDETPQSYMSVFGKGNRCVGNQPVKISQPQTAINMIFKGMAERHSPNRGLLIWHSTGSGKCLAKNTPVLMYDGTTKPVQLVAPGDLVMGDDSKPRFVMNLGRGRDMMFRIRGPFPGYEYTVNSEHILCLKWKGLTQEWPANCPGVLCKDGIVHIEARDYITLPMHIKQHLYGYVVPIVFPHSEKHQDTTIDYLTLGSTATNSIPTEYLTSSSKHRLQILSGIIGSRLIDDDEECISIDASNYSAKMKDDVLFLARSLGMIAYINITQHNKIQIWPDKAHREIPISVTYEGMGSYYGFELAGGANHRFILGNFTVTHNTCTAAGIMESFWDTDKEIIFASSVEALASNPPEAFMKCAENLFPRFKLLINPEGTDDKQNRPNDTGQDTGSPVKQVKTATARRDIEEAVVAAARKQNKQRGGMAGNLEVHPKVRDAFEQRGVKFFTFAQLAHYLLIDKPLKVKPGEEKRHRELLKNAILIIDEVHNIFKPLPHQKSEHFALRDFLMNYKNPLTSNLNIAILTATPGDTPAEIVDLLNMVRDRRSAPIRVPENVKDYGEFAKNINGLVSYFNIGSDMSKYPYVNKLKPHIAPMSMTQYKKYVEAFDEVKSEDRDFEKLVKADKGEAYYKGARKYSNSLFNWDAGIELAEFSSKIPALLEQIKLHPREKHYIYSTFFENRGYGGHGVLAIAKILEKELGYEKIDFKTARDINSGKLPPLKPGRRRYVLAITNELTEPRHTVGENLQELVKLFNQPANKDGDYVHIFLASQKFNEGVDFKAVRNVHIFEPFLSYNKELQTIGRGARYCSHKDLDINTGEWVVNVHKYLADFPVELKLIDIPGLKAQVEKLKGGIEDEDAKVFAVKGKRGKEFTKIREDAKAAAADLRKKLQQVMKDLKEATAIDPEKYFMIDQRIEEEVLERTRAQMYLLLVMKMMAVDCKLFKNFHAQSGDKYTCGAEA